MYSIIESCDETSGWRFPGLCNTKETCLYEDGGNLATMSPAGLNIIRCHKALLHTVDLHYRALPGEGVFLVKNVIGSIKAVVHYLSMTSCLSSKYSDTVCMKQLQQKQASTFRVQQLVPASVQLKEKFYWTTIWYSILCVWNVSRVRLIFVVTNISPIGRKFIINLIDGCVWGQCLASWYLTCTSLSVWGNCKKKTTWTWEEHANSTSIILNLTILLKCFYIS